MSKSGEEVGPKFVKLLDGSCVLRPYMFYQVLSGVIRCAPTSTATARRVFLEVKRCERNRREESKSKREDIVPRFE